MALKAGNVQCQKSHCLLKRFALELDECEFQAIYFLSSNSDGYWDPMLHFIGPLDLGLKNGYFFTIT